MTVPRVSQRPRARRDVVDHAVYISAGNLEAAERFLDAVERAFAFLAKNPEIGSPRHCQNPRLVGLRMWPIRGFRKYLVFYCPRADGIEVVRVLRGERDIAAILEKE
jgi:toxin ParE1/3/4